MYNLKEILVQIGDNRTCDLCFVYSWNSLKGEMIQKLLLLISPTVGWHSAFFDIGEYVFLLCGSVLFYIFCSLWISFLLLLVFPPSWFSITEEQAWPDDKRCLYSKGKALCHRMVVGGCRLLCASAVVSGDLGLKMQ